MNSKPFTFVFKGVPNEPQFEQPVEHTDSTFTLLWKCNSSINAPIINYQLEFREIPHGQWISVNVPASEAKKHHTMKKSNQITEFHQKYILKGLSKKANYQVFSSLMSKISHFTTQLIYL